jgi:hypothetical protein
VDTFIVPRVLRRFFAPDKEKCEAFLRAQKNVPECGVGMKRSE